MKKPLLFVLFPLGLLFLGALPVWIESGGALQRIDLGTLSATTVIAGTVDAGTVYANRLRVTGDGNTIASGDPCSFDVNGGLLSYDQTTGRMYYCDDTDNGNYRALGQEQTIDGFTWSGAAGPKPLTTQTVGGHKSPTGLLIVYTAMGVYLDGTGTGVGSVNFRITNAAGTCDCAVPCTTDGYIRTSCNLISGNGCTFSSAAAWTYAVQAVACDSPPGASSFAFYGFNAFVPIPDP